MSPDSMFIVSTSVDGTVVLFDVAENALSLLGRHDGPVLACAFSPDGRFVASAGADTTLRLWDLQSRDEMASVALTSGLQCVAVHPVRPMAICGDHAGAVHVIDLVGVEYGPLIVTAVDAPDRPEEPVILCPRCRKLLRNTWQLVGTMTTCPKCGAALRVNPFTASTPVSGESDLLKPFYARAAPRKRRWFGKR